MLNLFNKNFMEKHYAITVQATWKDIHFEKTEHVYARDPKDAEQKISRDYMLGDAMVKRVISVNIVED